jgi:hypothetical protein
VTVYVFRPRSALPRRGITCYRSIQRFTSAAASRRAVNESRSATPRGGGSTAASRCAADVGRGQRRRAAPSMAVARRRNEKACRPYRRALARNLVLVRDLDQQRDDADSGLMGSAGTGKTEEGGRPRGARCSNCFGVHGSRSLRIMRPRMNGISLSCGCGSARTEERCCMPHVNTCGQTLLCTNFDKVL